MVTFVDRQVCCNFHGTVQSYGPRLHIAVMLHSNLLHLIISSQTALVMGCNSLRCYITHLYPHFHHTSLSLGLIVGVDTGPRKITSGLYRGKPAFQSSKKKTVHTKIEITGTLKIIIESYFGESDMKNDPMALTWNKKQKKKL